MNASPLSHLRRLFACLSVCLLAIGPASAASPDKIDFTVNSSSSTIVGDVTVNLTSGLGEFRLRVLD